MEITGKAWKYGDDINTDVIFPGKYTYTISDPEEMAEHALEDLDPEFVKGVRPGDIIVGDFDGVVCIPAHLADEIADALNNLGVLETITAV